MKNHQTHFLVQGAVQRLWSFKRGLLLCALALAAPCIAWSQDASVFAPGVKVLATLQTSVYDWSPDGQRLAYATDDGIWVVKAPDFQQPLQLIRKGRGEYSPIGQISWSPDGQKLAFASHRPGDGWYTIWLTDADGAHVQDLFPPGTGPGSPGIRSMGVSTWLSDWEFAFVSGCGTECAALDKSNVKDGSSTNIRTGNVDGTYEWTLTKDRVAVRTHLGGVCVVDTLRPASTASATCSAEGCLACLEGCATRDPRWQGDEYYVNDWSPDGKRVLYMSGGPCEGYVLEEGTAPPKYRINLFLWDVTSGRQEQLVSNAGWATWSPDGTKIAFVLLGDPRYDDSRRIIGTDFVADRPFRLSLGIMEVATRTVPTLVPLGSVALEPWQMRAELGAGSNPFHPVWSPDSQYIVMQESQKDLFLIRADGTGRRPLTRGLELQANWSPDGKRLALRQPRGSMPVKQNPGPERYLPPVGKEEAALSDAEVIERYFEQILSKHRQTPSTIGEYAYMQFLRVYAQALEELGKLKAAEAQYRQGLELLDSDHWQDKELAGDLKQSYAAFLCGQGRKEEAAKLGGCPSWWEGLQAEKVRQAAAEAQQEHPWSGQPQATAPSHLRSPSAQPPVVSPELPALYIVEVPEERKQP